MPGPEHLEKGRGGQHREACHFRDLTVGPATLGKRLGPPKVGSVTSASKLGNEGPRSGTGPGPAAGEREKQC